MGQYRASTRWYRDHDHYLDSSPGNKTERRKEEENKTTPNQGGGIMIASSAFQGQDL